MSFRHTLARVLVFAVLHFGALAGVPMDPGKIRDLMEVLNRTRIEQVVKKEDPPTP